MKYKTVIALVDGQAFFRRGFKNLFENQRDILLLGCFASGKELINLCERGIRLDAVFIDLEMTNSAGTKLILEMRRKYPRVKTIGISSGWREENVRFCYAEKTFGLLDKTDMEENPEQIKCILETKELPFVSQNIRPLLPILFSYSEEKKGPERLSRKQTPIFQLIKIGCSLKTISLVLDRSKETVQKTASKIYRKYKVRNRNELINFLNREEIKKICER